MTTRLFAIIRSKVQDRRVRHTTGLPPEMSAGEGGRLLPIPDVLVIHEESQGNVFLYRLTRRGEFGGDTWHQSVEDAKHQADFEYPKALSEWQEIPLNAPDPCEFAVAAVGRLSADT